MKVVLSRKGFDSSNGGIVSPIFEDGSMVSFPIPSRDKDTYDDLQYAGTSYTQILSDLHYKGGEHCHVDPDLDQSRRCSKIDGWIPAFGQISASATYLKNIGIKPGDLFLFFGNFHFVRKTNDHYRYVSRSGDFYKDKDLQVIWGYLQIGDIVEDPTDVAKLWWHPHASKERIQDKTNVVFLASKTLSFDKNRSGAGLLPFHQDRVLTAENCKKATWKNNPVYDPDHIMGERKNSAEKPDNGIYYAGIWQELCLAESRECTRWAKKVLQI